MGDGYQPGVLRADFAACKRSILRYLNRYERDWGRVPVYTYLWEMAGCAPPEEDGAVMTTGRTRAALGALVREGLLQREERPGCLNRYALTDRGRSE